MAGIGFELKKIYREESIVGNIAGAAYSILVTVGPTIIVMLALLTIYLLLGYGKVPYGERELLSSTILYIFIGAVVLTAPINAVFSRYLADRIFAEEFQSILPSYYTGLAIVCTLATLVSAPVCYRLIVVGGVEPVFVLFAYIFWMSEMILYFSMTYLYATKDYRFISTSFIVGMIVALAISFGLYEFAGQLVSNSIITGFAIGTLLIAVLNGTYIRYYFRNHNKNYTQCLTYFGKYKLVFGANLLYFLGLYIHNFIYWMSKDRLVVAKTFVTMQSYDMATCLALITNLSILIIFTVLAETKFHDKFQKFVAAINGATLATIEKEKSGLFRLLMKQITQVFAIQTVITATIYLAFEIFLPSLGIAGMIMEIYPALAVAFLAIFLMYCNIVYFYYFDDNVGAFWSSLIFFLCTAAGTWVAKDYAVAYYGMGALFGGVVGWTFTYFRIRYMEKHFEAHVFCSQIITTKRTGVKAESIVYQKENKK
ncbi:MAG: exopolysaccharide Pel transporter PelG [Lachnospiraceae bacterium]|nr:exopolysaccharide Pel transporter PelG [Lachnospiraceae bacterium]